MPVYQRQIDVPAGTPQSNPETERVEIDEQWVDRAIRFAAPGSNNQVFAELRFGEFRLLPRENENAVVLPGSTDPEPIERELGGSPAELEWRAWSPAANFEHTLTLKIVTKDLGRANPLERLVDTFTGRTATVRRSRTQELSEPGDE